MRDLHDTFLRDEDRPLFAEQLQVEDDPRFLRKAWVAGICALSAGLVVVVAVVVMVLRHG